MSFTDEKCAARCRTLIKLLDMDIASMTPGAMGNMISFKQAQKYALEQVLGNIQTSASSILQLCEKE